MIGLAGGSHFDNFGDSLIFAIYLQQLKSLGIECTIICPTLSEGRQATHQRFLHRLREFDFPVRVVHVDSIHDKIDRCIFVGGGYLGWQEITRPLWHYTFVKQGYYRQIAQACRQSGIPYQIEGVEIGPILFSFTRRTIKEIVSGAESVVVRNTASRDFAESMGIDNIAVLPDVVLGNLDKVIDLTANRKNRDHTDTLFNVAIHLTGKILRSNALAHRYRNILQSSLEAVRPDIITLLFDQPTNPNFKEMVKAMRHGLESQGIETRVVNYQGVRDLLATLFEIDFLITSKLHCGVAALALNKYVVCIGSSPKLPRFYNEVNLKHHFLHYFASTSGAKLKFLQRHFMRARSDGPKRLISDEIRSESQAYMDNVRRIVAEQ